MAPAFTSDTFTRPGRTGSPAASAEVHPSVRSAFVPSGNFAPEPALHAELANEVDHVSKRWHEPDSITITCMSPPEPAPPSMSAVGGKGYGPGSLWSAD